MILGDTDASAGTATSQSSVANGGRRTFHALNAQSESAWQALFGTVQRNYGRLDVLVNNAGVDIPNDIERMSLAEWWETLGVNLDGTMLGMKGAIALMKSQRRGAIVNVASIASFRELG